MILNFILYLISTILVSLYFAARNGNVWSVKKCLGMGLAWPVTVPIMIFAIIYRKYKTRG